MQFKPDLFAKFRILVKTQQTVNPLITVKQDGLSMGYP